MVDDLQWADPGSISLLFHLGRHLAGSRVMIVGSYRPEDVALQKDGERHPLEAVLNELGREFGDILVNVDAAQGREFIDAYVDSEPNRLGEAFRELLWKQTRGQPLFTSELLRGLRDRGDLTRTSRAPGRKARRWTGSHFPHAWRPRSVNASTACRRPCGGNLLWPAWRERSSPPRWWRRFG
jgi:hypothetical protein